MNALSAFDTLEHEPLYEEPLFFIEPKDRDPADEATRVSIFRNVLRSAAPQAMVVGIPNAANRGQWAKNQAKKEGAYWGFPDLVVLAPSGIMSPIDRPLVAFLEFKAGQTMPAQHQIDCLNRLHRMGFPVGVFRNAETAVRFLRDHDVIGGGV